MLEQPPPRLERRGRPRRPVDEQETHWLLRGQARVTRHEDLRVVHRLGEGACRIGCRRRLRQSLRRGRDGYLPRYLEVDRAFARSEDALDLAEQRDVAEGVLAHSPIVAQYAPERCRP